ncbi:MAG: hypothetical protein K6E30_01870 [Lachnospiraceae bacterium]|nr:hypothetical protein [Lachnospiraceae bacterium]
MALTNESIEKKLADELASMTPDEEDLLFCQPVLRASGTEWYLPRQKQKKTLRKSLFLAAPALAAAFFLTFAAYYVTFVRTVSTVYVDVNPSICLSLNRKDQVTGAVSLNDDAATVLDGVTLKGKDVSSAVDLLLDRMVEDGYLTEENDLVLISVENENTSAGENLRDSLTESAYEKLAGSLGGGRVLGQEFHMDDSLKERSRELGISPGKARLIDRMAEEEQDWPREKLAGCSLAELSELMDEQGKNLGDYADKAAGRWTADREKQTMESAPEGGFSQGTPQGQAPEGGLPQDALQGQAPEDGPPQEAPQGQAPEGGLPQDALQGQAPEGGLPQDALQGQAPENGAPPQLSLPQGRPPKEGPEVPALSNDREAHPSETQV